MQKGVGRKIGMNELLIWMIRKILIWCIIVHGHHRRGKTVTEVKISLGVTFSNTNIFVTAQIWINWYANFWFVLKTWLPKGSFSGRRHDDHRLSSYFQTEKETQPRNNQTAKMEIKNRITGPIIWLVKRQLKWQIGNFWCQEDQHCQYQHLVVNCCWWCWGHHPSHIHISAAAAGSPVSWIWTLKCNIGDF